MEREKDKIRRMERKAAGLCIICGNPRGEDGTTVRCKACNDRQNEHQRQAYIYYRKIGICPRCRKNKLKQGQRQCSECAAYDAKRRQDPVIIAKTREYEQKSRKKIREKRKAAGLCVRCGKNPAVKGMTMCQSCREKRKIQAIIRKNRGGSDG